jgi:predicted enzyme related to lactoylglutathione lyase
MPLNPHTTYSAIDLSQIGEICWLDIPIKDSKRALPFYQDVFDWECKDAEGEVSREPGVLKRFFFSKGKTNGCFQLVEPENFVAPSLTPLNENKERWAVITSFAVEGIDDTLAKVERAGGNVYQYVFP